MEAQESKGLGSDAIERSADEQRFIRCIRRRVIKTKEIKPANGCLRSVLQISEKEAAKEKSASFPQ